MANDSSRVHWQIVSALVAVLATNEFCNLLVEIPTSFAGSDASPLLLGYSYDQLVWFTLQLLSMSISRVLCTVVVVPYAIITLWCGFNLKVVPESFAQVSAVFVMSNLHLTAYASVMVVFTLVNSTYHSAVLQFFLFVTFIPSPVILSFIITKLLSYKLGLPWGMLQKAICLIVVITFGVTCQVVQYVYVNPDTCWATSLMSVATFAYCAMTFSGEPEISGNRYWKEFLDLPPSQRLLKLIHDFIQLSLIWDDVEATVPALSNMEDHNLHGHGCVMGFHPHGMIPFTSTLIRTTQAWKQGHNGNKLRMPHPMLASPLHSLPLFKDVAQWSGCLEVSKDSISRVLEQRGSLILVPGGQVEMLTSKSWGNRLKINDQHSGFVRLALEHGAALVPVLSMGEWDLMDNIYLPSVQEWFKAKIGFPIPFCPYGSFIGTPRRANITIIIGKPIILAAPTTTSISTAPNTSSSSTAKHVDTNDGRVGEEEVKRVHRIYFDSLKMLFDKYKSQCGYGHMTMDFLSELETQHL